MEFITSFSPEDVSETRYDITPANINPINTPNAPPSNESRKPSFRKVKNFLTEKPIKFIAKIVSMKIIKKETSIASFGFEIGKADASFGENLTPRNTPSAIPPSPKRACVMPLTK